ncbi:hypothetical protein ASPBRDRAFT_274103 [Aspergillus brasiliensis CBS 101740]|uniref:Uncharacterized protein n=1 Tax=Aspergillus brasiliensis (strain CBS 101740 / IMI 381727 / IBT 21946) TaxID=767769 RepID=A0A1L9UCF8_ASPBC|nr:hypothetical protein ASPBRDRAFT_274103 [Aspergillus brasiliensis CBS 101740]
MHSRGLSDEFQPCGVARVMNTVDDDQPLTASADTGGEKIQSSLVCQRQKVERRWIDGVSKTLLWLDAYMDCSMRLRRHLHTTGVLTEYMVRRAVCLQLTGWMTVCAASRSWSPELLALALGPELSLSHATAQRPGKLQEAIISEFVLPMVPGNGLCPWLTSGRVSIKIRPATGPTQGQG